MFREKVPVGSTKITRDIDANHYFKYLGILPKKTYMDDESLIVTLRVLFTNRSERDRETVRFTANNIGTFFYSAINEVSNNVYIFFGEHDDREISERLLPKGFEREEKATAFYRKFCAVHCYIKRASKTTLVFCQKAGYEAWHYLQVSIPVFLPWCFEGENRLTEWEVGFLQSLCKPTADEYLEKVEFFCRHTDFHNLYVTKALSRYKGCGYENLIKAEKEEIKRIDDDIKAFQEHIALRIYDRDKICMRLLGLEEKKKEDKSNEEITEYFLSNKSLDLISVTDDIITFVAKGTFEFFDRDVAERIISNPSSVIYYTDMPHDDLELIMREVFLSERIKIQTCAEFTFSIANIRPCRGQKPRFEDYSCYMPNPHIEDFGCMGSYVQTIVEMLINGNYVGAIEQCLMSTKSLNFADTTVLQKFVWRLSYGTYQRYEPIFLLPDGKHVKMEEAIEWLKNQKE